MWTNPTPSLAAPCQLTSRGGSGGGGGLGGGAVVVVVAQWRRSLCIQGEHAWEGVFVWDLSTLSTLVLCPP